MGCFFSPRSLLGVLVEASWDVLDVPRAIWRPFFAAWADLSATSVSRPSSTVLAVFDRLE
eukprot:5490920-Pyramimonas_sp.AAC.1